MKRVTFYIDGFNFYFGIKRSRNKNPQWKKCYWIDLVKLCCFFLGENQILEKVVYFTASPLNPSKNSRQSSFLNANKLINPTKFEVVRGKYMEKQFDCPYCHSNISRPEEKRTDVNISVRMLSDCFEDKTDTIVLISADSDLIPPLEQINRLFPHKNIKVYFPPANYSYDIKDFLVLQKNKPVLLEKNLQKFLNSIMPDVVKNETNTYTIPDKWRYL